MSEHGGDIGTWLPGYAATHELSYELDADERWLRAFEPFVTLRTPLRYLHALHATMANGAGAGNLSFSLARFLSASSDGAPEASAWIVLAQDDRLPGVRAAATSEPFAASPFAEARELVSLPRRTTGDAAFDRVFASYGPTEAGLAHAITPCLRKLALSWRIPLHFEIRPGGFVLSPVRLRADPASLAWLLDAVRFFGDKAAKRVK